MILLNLSQNWGFVEATKLYLGYKITLIGFNSKREGQNNAFKMNYKIKSDI
ncbi:hypothetical protein HP2P_1820 [Hydrangea phyllody phytoplasma]|nr:hypothetical protein HP2P_1760 [Hydrangea phyllody phytoplasma]GLH61775.1 hypothetical protein HP2P_1820 [Hydrangea phyllody phytoplasma]